MLKFCIQTLLTLAKNALEEFFETLSEGVRYEGFSLASQKIFAVQNASIALFRKAIISQLSG